MSHLTLKPNDPINVQLPDGDYIKLFITNTDTLAIKKSNGSVIPIGGGKNYEQQDLQTLVSLNDGDKAVNETIDKIPTDGDNISIYIDGIKFNVGDGTKTKPFYFSNDGGNTAKGFNSSHANGKVDVGDTLHVNPSILGVNLSTTDSITIKYNI